MMTATVVAVAVAVAHLVVTRQMMVTVKAWAGLLGRPPCAAYAADLTASRTVHRLVQAKQLAQEWQVPHLRTTLTHAKSLSEKRNL